MNVQKGGPDDSTGGWLESSLSHARPAGAIVLCLVLTLVVTELALQLRSQSRFGQSLFNVMAGTPSYVYNEELRFRTLRPSAVIKGGKATIETNSLGLRGDDFDSVPPHDEKRIAILGASTAMGAFASRNENTSSERLQSLLRKEAGNDAVRVINAGIVGLTVQQQVDLLRKWIVKWGVSVVLWYPGTNDIGCRPPSGGRADTSVRIPFPRMPSTLLTSNLIIMNTGALRKSNAPSNQSLVQSLDLDKLHSAIADGIGVARRANIELVVLTSATSYRSSLPPDELAKRAATAVFFRPCYTPTELAGAVDRFNGELRAVAAEYDAPLIDAARLVPADLKLFGDANHFSDEGEGFFAELLAEELLGRQLLTLQVPP